MPKNEMMTPFVAYDPVTIYTFAMFSLLSGSVVCTQPTELEEVKLRYDDMLKMLGKNEPIRLEVPDESYLPNYTTDTWPWASTYSEMIDEMHKIADPPVPKSAIADLQVMTMSALLANDEIEEKYRLSRVRPKLFSQMLLPF